jgi:hypothetical protein
MNLITLAAEAHEETLSFWDEVISITFDPAHIFAEVFWQIVEYLFGSV